MKPSDFIKLQQKEKSNIFFSALRFRRAVRLRETQQNYKWEDPYKIYPSSLKSITMCPKKFIEEDVHKAPNFDLPVVYKMEVGKIIHELIQNQAMDINSQEALELLAEDDYRGMDEYLRKMYKREALEIQNQLLWERPRK